MIQIKTKYSEKDPFYDIEYQYEHDKETNSIYIVYFQAIEDTSNTTAYQCNGHVKWDECMNIDLKQDNMMKHFCSVEDIKIFSSMLEHIHNICVGIMKDPQ